MNQFQCSTKHESKRGKISYKFQSFIKFCIIDFHIHTFKIIANRRNFNLMRKFASMTPQLKVYNIDCNDIKYVNLLFKIVFVFKIFSKHFFLHRIAAYPNISQHHESPEVYLGQSDWSAHNSTVLTKKTAQMTRTMQSWLNRSFYQFVIWHFWVISSG